jgi:invasion protein IalB
MTMPFSAALSAVFLGFSLPGVALAQDEAPAPTEQNIAAQETPWQVTCLPGAEAGDLDCSMVKSLIVGQNRQVLAQAAVVAGDPFVLRVLVPHGMSLAEGLRISVDEAEVAALSFSTSLPGGALAVGDLTVALDEALRAGNLMQIEGVQNNGSTLRLEMGLSGFSAAIDKLQ